jgi:hypothetical protein
MRSMGAKRYIAELIREADRYELIADRLLGLNNKPTNWLDLWTGCRMRAWENRMRAETFAKQNRACFNRIVRKHIRGQVGCNAS